MAQPVCSLISSLLGASLLHIESLEPTTLWRSGSALVFLLGTPWLILDLRKVARLEKKERAGIKAYLIYPINFLAVGVLLLQVANVFVLGKSWPLFLALVLFIDAANANLTTLRTHARLPRCMLLIGLPLCIVLGAWVGTLIFPELTLFEVCLLATMLAATDAALGKGVVTNKAVPARVLQGLKETFWLWYYHLPISTSKRMPKQPELFEL